MELKHVYDAYKAAVLEAQEIAQQIEDLFEEGQVDEALAKRDEFQAAKQKAEDIKTLYDEMTSVQGENIAKRFVQASPTKTKADKTALIDRTAFNAMDHYQQAEFVKSGGQVVDVIEEGGQNG